MTNDGGDPGVQRGVEAVLHARRLVSRGEGVIIPLAVLRGEAVDTGALPQVEGLRLAGDARAEWEAAAPRREETAGPADDDGEDLRAEPLGRSREAGLGAPGSAPGGLQLGNWEEDAASDSGSDSGAGAGAGGGARAAGGAGGAPGGRVTVELRVAPGPAGRVGVRMGAAGGADGVEAFALDDGFDYDNVRLTPKGTLDAAGRAVIG